MEIQVLPGISINGQVQRVILCVDLDNELPIKHVGILRCLNCPTLNPNTEGKFWTFNDELCVRMAKSGFPTIFNASLDHITRDVCESIESMLIYEMSKQE